MSDKNDSLEIIGRSAELVFVDFSDVRVPAKIDTGAYRSAIHATDIHIDDDGVLHFRILGDHPVCEEAAFDASTNDYKVVSISNSFGDKEDRYEVKLRIKLGEQEYVTPFTLANRGRKIYPLLLGRKAIKNRYIVDVTKCGIDRVALKEKYKINLPNDEEQEDD